MNIIDLASVVILLLFILAGAYKGFFSTLLSIASYIISVILGFCLMPAGSAIVRHNERLFNMMLYYTEGSEFIANPEFVRTGISELSSTQLNEIVETAKLPYPMGREIASNIAREAFAADGITTLGDYFNQTIVLTFISILAFLAAFCIVRLILGFIVNGADYANSFPMLRTHDALLGACLGLMRGMFALFLIFMLVPIALTMFGQFDLVINMVDDSLFSALFYRLNFLLSIAA